MTNHPADPATVAGSLQVEGEFYQTEVDELTEHWSKLDSRLRSFRKGSVELNLWVKERDTPSQQITLEAKIAGLKNMVATSSNSDLGRALNEVRDEMIRQVTDAKNKTEPRNNRHLRDGG